MLQKDFNKENSVPLYKTTMTEGRDIYNDPTMGTKEVNQGSFGERLNRERGAGGETAGGSGEGEDVVADGSSRIWDARGKVEGHLVYRWRTNTKQQETRL